MGIVKNDDIICWNETLSSKILCNGCVDADGDVTPLTKDDIDDSDFISCDNCQERIQ